MNKGICETDSNWSNVLEYEKIEAEVFETAFYLLNFLCDNPDCKVVHELVFNALTEKRTYQDRVLFHAVATHIYLAKGLDDGSLEHWIRIIRNLTTNSPIDTMTLYGRAIDGINKLADNWGSLLEYFSQKGNVTGFSQDQIEEEQNKAQIILKCNDFAEVIYKAEQHPYFCGQIRSALYYSKDSEGNYDLDSFVQYWDKTSAIFDKTKPKHGHLLRRALLTFGDYTLPVSGYKTFCVDDPGEAGSTPSLKRLFSNHGEIVKQLLDALNTTDDIKIQLETIVSNAVIPRFDWRYCFVEFPGLFAIMSTSHLRIRETSEKLFIIPNKSSNGFNHEVFLDALQVVLNRRGLKSRLEGDLGTWADRYLIVGEYYVRFKNGHFYVDDSTQTNLFKSTSDDPIDEVSKFKF